MKKLFLLICLFMAVAYAQAAFAPKAGVNYNIFQNSSHLVIGPNAIGATQPAVMTLTSTGPQAFQFVAATDSTYYLINGNGNYFNNSTAYAWDVIYQTAINGSYSQWVIGGSDSTTVTLRVKSQTSYANFLSTDATTPGTSLYCNKTLSGTNATNGVFEIRKAIVAPTLIVTDDKITLEVEKNLSVAAPVTLYAKDQTFNIIVTLPAGFSTPKTTFAPADFVAANPLILPITAPTANIGDGGKIYFTYTVNGVTTKFDSVSVTAVATYPRFYLTNKKGGLVTTGTTAPMLAQKTGVHAQKFYLRRANPTVTPNDSVYYIVQDSSYNMVRKVVTSTYNTEFGASSAEAKWTLKKQIGGVYSLTNGVTTHALGVDAVIAGSALYDDKTFASNPTAKPFCEWLMVDPSLAFDASLSALKVNGSTVASFASTTITYNVTLPVGTTIVPTVTATSTDANAIVVVTPAAAIPGATTVVVTAVDGSTILTYTLNFAILTGLNTPTQSLYATVTGQLVKIQGTKAGDNVKVFNAKGQLVQQLTANSNTTSINLKSGVYLIKINDITLKIVK